MYIAFIYIWHWGYIDLLVAIAESDIFELKLKTPSGYQ